MVSPLTVLMYRAFIISLKITAGLILRLTDFVIFWEVLPKYVESAVGLTDEIF